MLFRRICATGDEPQRLLASGPMSRRAYLYRLGPVTCEAYTGRYLLQLHDKRTAVKLAEMLRPFEPVRAALKAGDRLSLWRRFVSLYLYDIRKVGPVAIEVAAAVGGWRGGAA
jgi:hypothetical protein